jgi:hypothetical protein
MTKIDHKIDDIKEVKIESNLFGEEVIKIESFSEIGVIYEVDKKKETCSCPHFQKGKVRYCKHLKKVLGIFDKEKNEKDIFDKEEAKRIAIRKSVKFSESILKSGMQKAIRRGETDKALVCAKALMKINESDFIRRLCVIVLEDVILHPDYDKMVEILKKTGKKNSYFTDEDKDFLINIVYDLAFCKYRDEFIDINQDDKECDGEMTEKEYALYRAIKYRAAVGGMKWDTNMLEKFARIWKYRFVNKKISVDDLKGYYRLKDYNVSDNLPYSVVRDEITVDDIILESVDFHCSAVLKIMMKKPDVIKLINEEYPCYDIHEILRKIMWRYRSGYSTKIQIESKEVVDWFKLKNDEFDENHRVKMDRINNYVKGEEDSIAMWFLKKQLE